MRRSGNQNNTIETRMARHELVEWSIESTLLINPAKPEKRNGNVKKETTKIAIDSRTATWSAG